MFTLEPYRSPFTSQIAQLIGAGDRARAQAAMVSGQAAATAAEQIGQDVSGTLGKFTQYKVDEPKRTIEGVQAKLAQKTLDDDQALSDAAKQSQGDPAQMLKLLESKGNFDVAMKLRGQMATQRLEGLKGLSEQLKIGHDTMTQASQLLQPVLDAKTPADAETAYQAARPQLIPLAALALQIDPKDPQAADKVRQYLPDHYADNPQAVASTAKAGWTITQAIADRRAAADAQRKTLQNAVTKQQLEKESTQNLAMWAKTITTPDDWAKMLDQGRHIADPDVAAAVVAKFPSEFSPDAPKQAAALLESPQATSYQPRPVLAKVDGKMTVLEAGYDTKRNLYFAPGDNEHPLVGARPIPSADQQSPQDRAELVKALLDNPSIYNDLTDSVKSGLWPDLHRAGFTPPGAKPKTDPAVVERWRQRSLSQLDDRYKKSQALPEVNGVMTADDYQAEKDKIEASAKMQLGGASASSPAAPKPAGGAPPPPAPKVKTGQSLTLGTTPVKVGAVNKDGSWVPDASMPAIVTVKGQKVKITKVYADGTFDGEPIKD